MAATSSSIPIAVVLLFLVLVASAVPATVGGEYSYSGASKMVIIRGPATTTRAVGGAAGAGAQSNKWRQHYGRRLVEDEVAPELGGGGLLLAADEGGIGYGVLDKDKPAGCQSGNQCATKGPGGSYTRGCMYESRCPHTPAGNVAN